MSEKPKITIRKKLTLTKRDEDDEPAAKIKFKQKASELVSLRKKKTIEENEGNLNQKITEVLEQLVQQISDENKSITDKKLKTKNNWRIRSIRKAIAAIKEHDEEITSGYAAKQIPGVGDGVADRIDIILETGTLPELEDVVNEETKAVESLMTIHGMGAVHALDFYRKYGVKSATDLIKKWQAGEIVVGKHQLTHDMEIGLKYYDDFIKRIPRSEIDEFKEIITPMIKEIDPKLVFTIVGSYRRKKATSGDIDILMAHKDLKTQKELDAAPDSYLSKLIDKLLDEGLITDHLSLNVTSYYKGVILFKDTPRRIDIMITPLYAYPAAILHGTGSGPFNQRLRAHAMKKGYTLSQKGLFELDSKGKKKPDPLPVHSEQDIFRILGVQYLPPEDRD